MVCCIDKNREYVCYISKGNLLLTALSRFDVRETPKKRIETPHKAIAKLLHSAKVSNVLSHAAYEGSHLESPQKFRECASGVSAHNIDYLPNRVHDVC